MLFLFRVGGVVWAPPKLLTLLSQNGIGNYSAECIVKNDTIDAFGGVVGVVHYSAPPPTPEITREIKVLSLVDSMSISLRQSTVLRP